MSEIAPSDSSPDVAAPSSAPREERRRTLVVGLLIFALALGVRIIGLTWGLPNAERWYSYHPDESTRQIVGAVANIIGGEHGFDPKFFNYPSLSIYATWLFYQVMAGFGLTTNVPSPNYPWPFLHDIILAGRLFSALCGAGTAVLVWGIAQRLGLRRGALLAALLTALAPGFVQHSHFATVDVPATFFATWCLWLTLRATTARGWLGAAVVAGLAAGTKYNVGLVLIAPLVALWLSGATDENSKAPSTATRIGLSFGCIVAAMGAFLISTPYALLDFPTFWGDPKLGTGFYFEAFVHPKIGSDDVFLETGNGWWYHFSFNLPFVLTWPLVIAALVGIGFAARSKNRAWWPILAFLGLFFFSLGFSQVRFMRYLLPLVPALCLCAAYAAARLPRPQDWGAVVAIFALWGTKDVLWPFVSVDPRDQNILELRQGYKSGKKIALIGNPWFYTPPFQPQGLNTPVPGVTTIGYNYDAYLKVKPDYLVMSEYEYREAGRLFNFGRDIPLGREKHYPTELQKFNFWNNVEGDLHKGYHYKIQIPLPLPGRGFVPHDYLYTNPQVDVIFLS